MTRVLVGLFIMVALPAAYLLACAINQTLADSRDGMWRE